MYDLRKHNRRSLRLQGYDYSGNGAYFITICAHNREHRFGSVTNGTMLLNEFGEIAAEQWLRLDQRFENMSAGVFVVMPNHVHGVLHITQDPPHAGQPQGFAPTVGDIVGSYKSLVVKECLKLCRLRDDTLGKLWQRNYYEHIIRNEVSYNMIADYIFNNPRTWTNDILY